MSKPTTAADSAAPAPATSEPINPLANAFDSIVTPPSGDSYLDDVAKRFADAMNPQPPATPAPADPVKPAAPTETPDISPVTPGVDDDGLPLADPDAKPGPDGKDTPQSSWAKLRAKADAAEKKAKEFEARVAEYEAKLKNPVIDPELKKKAELAEQYEQRLALVDVEATAPYVQQVKAPAEALITKLDTLAKSYDEKLSADNFIAAFNIADPKARREELKNLTEDMDVVDQARVRTMAEDWSALLEKRDAIKANAAQALAEAKQMEEQNRLAMTARERETYSTAVNRTVEKLKAALPQVTPGDDESVQKLLQEAAAGVTDQSFELDKPEVRAFAAISGAILPGLVTGIRARDARIKELEDTVAAYTKQAPRGSSGSPVPSNPGTYEPTPPGMTYGEAAGRRFEEMLQSMNR